MKINLPPVLPATIDATDARIRCRTFPARANLDVEITVDQPSDYAYTLELRNDRHPNDYARTTQRFLAGLGAVSTTQRHRVVEFLPEPANTR